MQLKKIAVLFCGICSLAVFSAGIELLPNGTLELGGSARLGIAYYSDKWVPRSQADSTVKTVRTEQPDRVSVFRSVWNLPGGKTAQSELQAKSGANGRTCSLKYEFTAKEPVPTASLSVQLVLPAWTFLGKPLIVDGKEFLFPEKITKSSTVASFEAVRKVVLPLKTGILTILAPEPVKLLAADFRPFHHENFALRFAFRPERGELTRSGLRLDLSFEPYVVFPLALESAANMGFCDVAADDRKGGWTDQGPTNDLHMLKSGEISVPPMKFRIIDPAKNGGKSCLVLGGGGKPYFPRKAVIPADGRMFRTVCLLHALAWPPVVGAAVGTVTVNYRDGHKVSRPVVAGRDVANWWDPIRLKNGLVGWRGHNAESTVGLYLSSFRFPAGAVDSVTLESNGKSVWMIVAAGASPQEIRFAEPATYTAGRNAEWRCFPDSRRIESGSALDFSFLRDAPAGKYGFVRVKDGHFQFEKSPVPVRFFGGNICFRANYLSHGECDALAERLARTGYNAVRLHHFDRDVVKHLPKDSTTVEPKSLKMLDYLIFALKKQGIYITTDLFTVRTLCPGEFPSLPHLSDARAYKLAAMILPEVNQNLKTLARRLFTHFNPYTGLRWADDPVFIGISLINENTILHNLNMVSPEIRKLYRDRFAAYAKKNGLAVDGAEGEVNFRRFVLRVYHDYYRDMVKFMRGLGVRAPITDQNYIPTPNATEQRVHYDYVDNHVYWDHPKFVGHAWSLPAQFSNSSVLKSRLRTPAVIAASRIFGKPFTVTEYDFCYPNRFRAEGLPIFAAYAAMQDWDGIYHFAYASNRDNMFPARGIEIFDSVNDPVRILSQRISAVFFRRRDVKSAVEAFPVVVSPKAYLNYMPLFPVPAGELMFFGRVGSVLRESSGKFVPPLPEGTRAVYALDPELKTGECKVPLLRAKTSVELVRDMLKLKLLTPAETDAAANRAASSTGQLFADFDRGTFRAETPESVLLVLPGTQSGSAGPLSVAAMRDFAVFSAIAIDGKPLKQSGRILLLHLTDVKQEGDKFSADGKVLLSHNGRGVPLARHGVAELTVKCAGEHWKLYALDLSGRRIAEISFRRESGAVKFRADNFAVAGQVIFAYELTCSGASDAASARPVAPTAK